MNKELIESLSEKAVELVQNRPNGTCDMRKYNVEFARLIVEECIKLCDEVDLAGADDCIDNIKDHFDLL